MKKNYLITINSMEIGGIQKSLLEFLRYVLRYANVDLLVWNKEEQLPVPDGVHVISIPTVKSVTRAKKENGIFSGTMLLSMAASRIPKRWKIMPRTRKSYDVAISYSQVGYGRYYVIDKVNAAKKFAFYHHGEYQETKRINEWDKEYYSKYDYIFVPSEYVQRILINEAGIKANYVVLPNMINVKKIIDSSQDLCPIMEEHCGLKILTICRLSVEKNLFLVLDVCEQLKKQGIAFKWFIVGGGSLYNDIRMSIQNRNLNGCCVLCGSQTNPYPFIRCCDVYVQLSKFESEGITIKEVAALNKPMVLNNIPTFTYFAEKLGNITICNEDPAEIAKAVLRPAHTKKAILDVEYLNLQSQTIIDHFILERNE